MYTTTKKQTNILYIQMKRDSIFFFSYNRTTQYSVAMLCIFKFDRFHKIPNYSEKN